MKPQPCLPKKAPHYALTIDTQGNLYVGCTHYLAKVTPSAVVKPLAGSTTQSGVDGFGAQATFNSPLGILYVADNGGQVIRPTVKSPPSGGAME